MIDMAIGVIIGGAFTALVGAFTANIVNPLVSLIPGVNSLDEALKIVVTPAVLDEAGKVDPGKLQALQFDQFRNGYYAIGEKVGKAWNAGAALMKES
jgi:large-conductance mechanosensitive channel